MNHSWATFHLKKRSCGTSGPKSAYEVINMHKCRLGFEKKKPSYLCNQIMPKCTHYFPWSRVGAVSSHLNLQCGRQVIKTLNFEYPTNWCN